MALETKLYQKLSQQLVMTPQLRQAIKILQVSRAELETLIDEELAREPGARGRRRADRASAEERAAHRRAAREQRQRGRRSGRSRREERETTTEVEPERAASTSIDWKEYLDNYSNDWHGSSATPADYDDEKRPTPREHPGARRRRSPSTSSGSCA